MTQSVLTLPPPSVTTPGETSEDTQPLSVDRLTAKVRAPGISARSSTVLELLEATRRAWNEVVPALRHERVGRFTTIAAHPAWEAVVFGRAGEDRLRKVAWRIHDWRAATASLARRRVDCDLARVKHDAARRLLPPAVWSTTSTARERADDATLLRGEAVGVTDLETQLRRMGVVYLTDRPPLTGEARTVVLGVRAGLNDLVADELTASLERLAGRLASDNPFGEPDWDAARAEADLRDGVLAQVSLQGRAARLSATIASAPDAPDFLPGIGESFQLLPGCGSGLTLQDPTGLFRATVAGSASWTAGQSAAVARRLVHRRLVLLDALFTLARYWLDVELQAAHEACYPAPLRNQLGSGPRHEVGAGSTAILTQQAAFLTRQLDQWGVEAPLHEELDLLRARVATSLGASGDRHQDARVREVVARTEGLLRDLVTEASPLASADGAAPPS